MAITFAFWAKEYRQETFSSKYIKKHYEIHKNHKNQQLNQMASFCVFFFTKKTSNTGIIFLSI